MRDEDLEKYRKKDGSIDWVKCASDELLITNNQLLKKKHIAPLKELSVFKMADELSDYIWNLVLKWDYFAKKTVGDQVVRSADSVGANIAEGYGRYFFGEYIIFLYYARGSVFETGYWAEKALKRKLIGEKEYEWIKQRTDKLPLEINKVIKIVKTQKEKWKGKPKY